jgi:deoxyadenosine/deoxycytidine kinase
VLLERIRKRNRAYEATIDESYLDSLREAYEKAFRVEAKVKIIRYNTSRLDLNVKTDVNRLHETILGSLSEN